MSDVHLTDTAFSSLDLPPILLQGIEEAGFTKCTQIQAQTLPLALTGQDVAGQAQTGTGKTAAFLLATMAHLLRHPLNTEQPNNQPRALILAPTRELAIQIHRDAEALNHHTDLRLGLVYGGSGYASQRQQLEQGVDILIGTPGRLIDYFKQHIFNLKQVQVVVLDEADRMFDLGFIKDIRFLLRRCPKPEQRLSLLFSATLSFRVTELAYEHMNNPQLVRIDVEQVTASGVQESVYYPANTDKIPLLLGLLQKHQPERAIIFTNTKHTADQVWGYLEGNGFHTAILSGDIPQKKRVSLLKRFQEGELSILVATDVAARGLHIEGVSHVFNYDLPQDPEDYVHRIGRTARAGATGEAISFACEEYAYSLGDIEEYIGHKIPREALAEELLITPQPRIRREKKPRTHSGNTHKPRRDGDKPRRRRRKRPNPSPSPS